MFKINSYLFLFVLTFVTVFPNISRADISTGLVGWWKFDEGSGTTANDSSGNNNTGILANGASWVAGKFGQAISLDGIDDYVQARSDGVNVPSLAFGTAPFTVSFWIKTPDNSAWNYGSIVSGRRNSGWEFQRNSFGKVRFIHGGGSYLTSNANVYDNNWHHIVGLRDGANVYMYVDGVAESPITDDHGDTNIGSPALRFGASGTISPSSYHGGALDEIRIYNRALSAFDVAELYSYAGTSPVIPAATPTPTPVPVTPTPTPTPTPTQTPVPVTPTPTPTITPIPTPTQSKVELLNSSGSVINTFNTIQACANGATAGYTCKVYAGSYDEYVLVSNSGTQINPIRFQASGVVKLPGFAIISKNYIVIDGFEITDLNFTQHAGPGYSYGAIYLRNSIGSQIINNYVHHTNSNCMRIHESQPSSYLIVRNNRVAYCGTEPISNGGAHGIQVDGSYILVEGNDISHVTDYMSIAGQYNVARKNIFHDSYEADFPGTSNALHIDGIESSCAINYYPNPLKYALYENNILYNTPVGNAHFTLLQDVQNCGATNVIVRYNTVYSIGSYFIVSDTGFDNIKEYNNTIYQALRTANLEWVVTGRWGGSTGGKIINNIYADTIRDNAKIYDSDVSSTGFYASNNLAYNPACGANCSWQNPIRSEPNVVLNQNPLFVNSSGADFHLQSNSPAIDRGGPLTNVSISDSGSGTSLIVDDAGMFQAGQGGIVNEDWIAIGSANNISKISSINYSTNIITLVTPLSRAVGNPVYLYKNSEGTQVLYGSAPDIGAYEYTGTPVSTPTPVVTPTPTPSLPDTTAPTVSITSPSNNTTISNTVTLIALAQDPTVQGQTTSGIQTVQFKLDNINLGQPLTTAPYSGTWNTQGVSNGSHTLTAVATDVAGNTTTSNPITITISNTISSTPTPTPTSTPTPSTPASGGGSSSGGGGGLSGGGSNSGGGGGTSSTVGGSSVGTFTPTVPQKPLISKISLINLPKFIRALRLGSTGQEVKNLQIFLNNYTTKDQQGKTTTFEVQTMGLVGSKGKESTYFGPATYKAVTKFQEFYANDILLPNGLTKGTGILGPSTIKKINSLISKK